MQMDEQQPDTAKAAPLGGADKIRSYLKTLPDRPGVYRMLDEKGNVLYVGKAKSLKRRVSSYASAIKHSNRIARMISMTAEMEFITTHTEVEALLLESNLIKKLKPRYNILLRDDKSFPYMMITGATDWPQIVKHRGARSRPGEYFGPFATAGAVNRTLNTLQRAFLLRSCSDSVFQSRTRPCLLYQIKRCCGPCVGKVTVDEYADLVSEARNFLEGKSRNIQKGLSERMETASEALDYEQAAIMRDRIRALTQVQVKQGINVLSLDEADVIAAHHDGPNTCVQVFFFRAGQNWGNRSYFPRHDKSDSTSSVLTAFIGQFYDNKTPPKLLIINEAVAEKELLSEALSIKAGRKVRIEKPSRGDKKVIIDHAVSNAREALQRRMTESASQRRHLEGLADLFGLEAPPERIEVYDNSHISGTNQVGAMVVAGSDGFEKNHYRKFNIKSKNLEPGDDYGMMREVLTRRFKRLQSDADKPDKKEQWPDVVILDGGQGQLSVGEEVFSELGIDDVTLVSIAKGPDRNAGRERFFMPGREPFSPDPKSSVMFFLQRLRDESHRFAIGTHRAKRAKTVTRSALDSVEGVGPSRKRLLLHHFGSAAEVERAGLKDLKSVDGISGTLAQKIYDHFHG